MELFHQTYGLGKAGRFSFYKFAPQREVFLGFDQAFAMTDLSDGEFFALLSASAMDEGYRLPSKFLAYFLQFKVVSLLHRRQKRTPSQIRSRPHYRASLDTTKNDRTGFSQHELLCDLSRNEGAMVYYACPMIFDKTELYEVQTDLDLLRLADVKSCPSNYTDNGKHYIYFDQKASEPIWCSDPVEGKGLNPAGFADLVFETLSGMTAEDSVARLRRVLARIRELGQSDQKIEGSPISLLADSLTIVRLDQKRPG
jgi:hypothetical protein